MRTGVRFHEPCHLIDHARVAAIVRDGRTISDHARLIPAALTERGVMALCLALTRLEP
jgi:hypothetical protein